MGNASVISYNESRRISTNILQLSNQTCSISCNNNLSNSTFIFVNVEGNIKIAQSCSIVDSSCAFRNAFEANIENIIESLVKQENFSLNGFSFNFDASVESTNINSIIQNNISQIMNSSCAISVNNVMNNNYFYVDNLHGDFDISQSGTISSSTCAMDNISKATSFNETVADIDQSNTTINVISLIFIAFIVLIIVMGIVASIFILSGNKLPTSNLNLQESKMSPTK
jgi:hypothetical protein